MLSVSERYLQSVVADSRNMPYRVTITGVGLLDRSKVTNMTLEESVSGTSGIELGTANSATLRLTIKDAQPIDYIDLMVLPESGLVLPDGSIEWVPLGVFWVTDSSTSNDYKTLNLTCSDGMYNMSGEYVSRLTYPSTIKAVVAEIVAQAGVEFEGIDSLPDIPVRRRLEGATHRVAIGYAAGCCGKNARFNRQGKLEFTWYTDTGITIERRTQYLDGMTKLNNRSLDVVFEVTGQQEMYSVETISDGNGGLSATPGKQVLEGETVVLTVSPFTGYELATIFAVTEKGDSVALYKESSVGYTFVQPDCNVVVTASFRTSSNGPFRLTTRAYEGGTITQEAGHHDAGRDYFNAGDTATVTIVPDNGKQIDRIVTTPGNLELTPKGASYSFVMPQSDVTVTVYFKDAEAVVTPYSWLQKPVAPPADKPYWAVFYKDDPNLPTCQKYYLIWFDSWSASLYDTAYDLNEYKITLNGYYYCGSKNNGNGVHEWDGSVWTGNGDAASSVSWNSYLGFMWSGADNERVEKQYCLIASNADLIRNGSVIFESNEEDITGVQTSYVQSGMDVRERGSLSYWMCPDTFSTPLPSPNWMILMPESGLYMTVNEEGKYETPLSSYPSTMIVLFYDSISIKSIGAVGNQSSEEFYIASVTNGRWAYLRSENVGWDELHELPDGAVIGLRNPLISTESEYIYFDYNSYQFAGVLATNTTLYAGGSVLMYNNACRICDCASTANVSTFSMRRSVVPDDAIVLDGVVATTDGDAILLDGKIAKGLGDSIVLVDIPAPEAFVVSYTNPMIYEKMVPYITSVVRGVSYTPAKVKHRGNPAFQAGDVVQTPDGDGVLHTILVMQQRMVFGGGMNSEITCPGQTEKTKSFSASSVTNPATQAVERATADLERRVSVNNALVYAAMHKSISASEANIESLVQWQTEASSALSVVSQTASKNEASIKSLVEWQGTTSKAVASIDQRVSNAESTIELLTKFDEEGVESLAGLVSQVNAHEASIKTLSEWQSGATETLTEIEQKSNEHGASISLLSSYGGLSEKVTVDSASDKTSWDKGKLYYAKDSGKHYAWRWASGEIGASADGDAVRLTSVGVTTKDQAICLDFTDGVVACSYGDTVAILSRSAWVEVDPPLSESVAKIEQVTNAHEARINSLVEWQGESSTAMASVTQKANANEASIKSIAEWQSEATKSFATIEQKVNKDGAAIELLVEYDSAGKPKASGSLIIGAINGESSAKISADRLDIEGKTLNIKVDHTNIVGKITADQLSVAELASLDATIGGFDISESGLSKTVTTFDSSSGTNIILTEKVNITPDLILVEEDKSVGSPLMYYNKKVEISNGSIHVTRSGIDTVLGANPSFMDVTIKGKTYKLYIDTSTLAVKVEAV